MSSNSSWMMSKVVPGRSIGDRMASSSRGIPDTWQANGMTLADRSVWPSVSLGALCAGSCRWCLTATWEHITDLSRGGATSLRSLGVLQTGDATPTPQCHVAGHVHVYRRALSGVWCRVPVYFQTHSHASAKEYLRWAAYSDGVTLFWAGENIRSTGKTAWRPKSR